MEAGGGCCACAKEERALRPTELFQAKLDKGPAGCAGQRQSPPHTSQPGTAQPAVGHPVGELTWSGGKLYGVKGAPGLCLCWSREARRAARRLMADICNYQALRIFQEPQTSQPSRSSSSAVGLPVGDGRRSAARGAVAMFRLALRVEEQLPPCCCWKCFPPAQAGLCPPREDVALSALLPAGQLINYTIGVFSVGSEHICGCF